MAENHLKATLSRYPNDVGIVYRHWPLSIHENAYPAARAVECAANQGRFWEFHDRLFNDPNWLGDVFQRFAIETGVPDLAEFQECALEIEPVPTIEADIAAAEILGARGTPTFLINGLHYSGILDSLVLFDIVEEAKRYRRIN